MNNNNRSMTNNIDEFDKDDLKEQDAIFRAFLLFMRTAQAVFKYSDMRFYATLGFSTATFAALRGLTIRGGTSTHTELAKWTNTEPHNITGIVRRFEKAGLVTTERDTKDRRVVHIHITDKGREVWDKASQVAKINTKRLMEGFNKDQALELEKLLSILKGNSTYKKRKKVNKDKVRPYLPVSDRLDSHGSHFIY